MKSVCHTLIVNWQCNSYECKTDTDACTPMSSYALQQTYTSLYTVQQICKLGLPSFICNIQKMHTRTLYMSMLHNTHTHTHTQTDCDLTDCPPTYQVEFMGVAVLSATALLRIRYSMKKSESCGKGSDTKIIGTNFQSRITYTFATMAQWSLLHLQQNTGFISLLSCKMFSIIKACQC